MKWLLTIAITLITISCFGQNLSWTETFPSTSPSNRHHYFASALRSDGNVLMLINDTRTSHIGEIWLIDTAGYIIWKKPISINGLISPGARIIEPFPNLDLFLIAGTGWDSVAQMSYYGIIDSAGNTLVSETINYPGFQGTSDVLILPDNSFLFLGGKFNSDADLFILRANSNGILWQKEYIHPGSDSPRELVDLFNGRYLIVSLNDHTPSNLEIDTKGNFFNSNSFPSTSNEVTNLHYSHSPDSGFFITYWESLNPNDILYTFYHIQDSTKIYEFDFNYISGNLFRLNSDSNVLIPQSFSTAPGASLYRDSTLIWRDSITSPGLNRGIRDFCFLDDGNAIGFGNQSYFGDFNVWAFKINNIGQEWMQNPCIVSSPIIGFKWTYQFPTLTLIDTSFSGLTYYDTLYNKLWSTSTGIQSSQDTLVIFWDTTGQNKIDIKLSAENWYKCVDSVQVELGFWPISGSKNDNYSWSFNVYPNPYNDDLMVQLSHGNSFLEKPKLTLINSQGKAVETWVLNESTNSLSLKHTPPGVYEIKIEFNNEIQIKRILKSQ